MKIETLLFIYFLFFIFALSICNFTCFCVYRFFDDLPAATKKSMRSHPVCPLLICSSNSKNSVREEQLFFLILTFQAKPPRRQLNISVTSYNPGYYQETQMSFPRLYHQYRIELRKTKLSRTQARLQFIQISLDVGFNSKAAFYTAFKKNGENDSHRI